MRKPRTLLSYLAAFAFVLTVPILVGALISTYQFAASERARLEALVDNANRDIVTLVERELSARVAMLKALATAFPLKTGDISQIDRQARELSLQTGVPLVLYDLAGRQLVDTRLPESSPLPRISVSEMIREVTTTKRVHVSNLIPGSADRKPEVRVAVPVMRGGDVVAVLSSTVDPIRLVELLRQSLPEGPFYATVLDRAGVIVARSLLPEQFIGKPLPSLAEAAKGTKGVVSVLSGGGVPIFGFYRRPELSGWVIAAAVEHAALTAPLTRSLKSLALVAAGLAAMASIGAWWVGRKLTRAHGSLVTAAEALGKGQVIAPPATALHEANLVGDALAAASRSLAHQANDLQRAKQDLEERVDLRTSELARKTALLKTTLDTMKQGLIVIDGNGRIAVCNPQAQAMLDLSDDALKATPTVDELLAFQQRRSETISLSPEQMHLLKPSPGDDVIVFEQQLRNGAVLEVQTVPVSDGGGFVRTYTDVTQQHRHAHDLEEAKEAAEQATRAKGDFLATMSHEMRTPLNAVIGYSELLLHRPALDADARRSAERIQSAGSALLCLIDDILDLGKIEAGILDVRTEPFSLPALIDDAVSFVGPSAHEKGLELEVSLDAAVEGFFLGDLHRLRQILLNLLTNAIKFTPSGKVKVCVRELAGGERRRILRFAISDTGIGIAKAEQAGLFQRFHQIDPAANRRFGGAGLGLAISKQLVERMGGSIGVESNLGTGSTFWVELALVPAVPAVAVERVSADDATPKRRGARILVAEDVAINQELARELLEAAGHTVEVVANGAQAVDAVKGCGYDLVLMDLSMPEMDGLTATRLIRAAGSGAEDTPIVACTANVVPAQIAALSEAGTDAFLRKPLRRKELYATIERILARNLDRPQWEIPVPSSHPEPSGVQDVVSLLGPKRVIMALDRLTQDLRTLTVAEPTNITERQQLAERAHAVISTASMLELTELAENCRDLENACHEAVGVAQALERLGHAVTGALAEGDRLRSYLECRAA